MKFKEGQIIEATEDFLSIKKGAKALVLPNLFETKYVRVIWVRDEYYTGDQCNGAYYTDHFKAIKGPTKKYFLKLMQQGDFSKLDYLAKCSKGRK